LSAVSILVFSGCFIVSAGLFVKEGTVPYISKRERRVKLKKAKRRMRLARRRVRAR